MNRLVTLVKNDTGPDLTVVIVRNENNDRFVTDASNVFLNIRRKDTSTNIVSIAADEFKSTDTQGQYVFNLKSFSFSCFILKFPIFYFFIFLVDNLLQIIFIPF